jgi:hypothetical protein
MFEPRRGRPAWRLVNALLAIVVCAAVLGLLAFGYGPVPALERTLGPAKTMAWFPVLPPGPQHPYDPGPYRNRGIAAAPGLTAGAPGLTAAAPGLTAGTRDCPPRSAPFAVAGTPRTKGSPPLNGPSPAQAMVGAAGAKECLPSASHAPSASHEGSGTGVRAAEAVLAQVRALPVGQVHAYPDSTRGPRTGPRWRAGVSAPGGPRATGGLGRCESWLGDQ